MKTGNGTGRQGCEMDNGSLDEIERQLEYLWANYTLKPEYLQMRLKEFRENCALHGPLPHAVEFLKQTANVNENAIVVMRPFNLSLLTDEDGNLLEFS